MPTGAAILGDTDSDVPPHQTQETHGRCSAWEICSAWERCRRTLREGAGGAEKMLCLDKRLPRSPASPRARPPALPRELLGGPWGQEVLGLLVGRAGAAGSAPAKPRPSLLASQEPKGGVPQEPPPPARVCAPGAAQPALPTNNLLVQRKPLTCPLRSPAFLISNLLAPPSRSSKSLHTQVLSRTISPSGNKPRGGFISCAVPRSSPGIS